MFPRTAFLLTSITWLGCSAPIAPPLPPLDAPPSERAESVDLGRWEPATSSPQTPQRVTEPELARRCGAPDAALQAVAKTLAEEGADGGSALDMPRLGFELRVEGAPYVWPHLWTIAGTQLEPSDVSQRFDKWLGAFSDGGERRCGIARARTPKGREIVVAVVVDVSADLAPLPSSSSVGRWLELNATLLVPTTDASVVLLGPRGRPQEVPSRWSSDAVKASFAPSQSGRWLVQVVANTETGPRPVARAVVHVDQSPPDRCVSSSVPGEEVSNNGPPDEMLARMILSARQSEGLPRLPRRRELDTVAREQAEAMLAAQQLGHDVGQGSVRDRLSRAGVDFNLGGENVARAGSVRRAHRVIWESPSHRETLLYDRYDAFGVGVAKEPNGTVWVCEVFARF